jgi:phage shock protein PspC (stress-responsive transcriptional regulator)
MTSTPAGPDTGHSSGHPTGHPTGDPHQPPYPPNPVTGPRVTADQVRDLSRLRRITVDRKVAGVAGGIARHLDIDPVIVRVAFVVLSLFGGAGLVLYAGCWILIPEDGQQGQPLGLDERSRSVALILVGILGLALLVKQWDWFWVPGPLILVALVVWLILSRRGGDDTAVTAPPAAPDAGPDAVTPEQRWAAATSAGTPTATAPAYEPATPAPVPPAYQQATYQQPAYAAYQSPPGPPLPTHYVAPQPRNPRKRGPKLFWFTAALALLAVGVVSIIDIAGASVAPSLYPATILAVIGTMLLVGAFYGRAGGLILAGLLAAAATGIGLASEKVDDQRLVTPQTASLVEPAYDYGNGQFTLDLSQLADPQSLDGQTITLTAGVGELDVVVPRHVDVTVHAVINGPGEMSVLGNEAGGFSTDRTYDYDGGSAVPHLTLDLELDAGHVDVRTR